MEVDGWMERWMDGDGDGWIERWMIDTGFYRKVLQGFTRGSARAGGASAQGDPGVRAGGAGPYHTVV